MDAAPATRLYLDTVIVPTRSLPVKGFAILFGVLAAANLLVGALFFALGAWPAPIFLGLDLLAVGWPSGPATGRRACANGCR